MRVLYKFFIEQTELDNDKCCTIVSGSVMVLSSMLVQVWVNSSSTFMADSSAQIRLRWSCRELQGVSCRSFTRFQNPIAKIFVKIVFIFRILRGDLRGVSPIKDITLTGYQERP
jgi:hypothetical protein